MTNKDFALNYLKNGISVFPTHGKKPLVSWEKYSKEKPTEQDVIDWWTKWPDADIAGATGAVSGLIVIDVDGGEVPKLPPTAVSETSPGHYQYFFKHPGFPVQNSAKVIASNVDVRGDGGFVVLPPSRHFSKETGAQDFTYKWALPPKEAGFVDLPQELLEKVKTKKSLDSVVTGSTQGSRNNDATVVAGSLLSKHPRSEWETICWPLLQGWNEKNNPPLSENELRSVFNSISQREHRKKESPANEKSGLNKINPELLDKPITLKEVFSAVDSILPGKHDLLLLAMATSISHLIDKKTPLWIMFVGVPSSAKTEVARMLTFYPNVFFLDALTENAFVSGAKNHNGSEPTDLLPLLNGKCFIIKDFTTTLSQREESVRKILGDLTSIYDDSFVKHSPARGTISYHSFFSILGCVTPQALNRHQRYMNQIGPRFLFLRVPSSEDNEINQALEILWSVVDSKPEFEAAQQKVSAYCYQLSEKIADLKLEKESKEAIAYLNSLAKFIAKARGMVLTRNAEFLNTDGEKVSFYEPVEIQVEEPFRALLQLRVLARALAVVKNKTAVGPEELDLVRKVALSSMPADRSLLLSVIAKDQKAWSAKEIADELGISHKTALRQLDELVSLKVLAKSGQGNGLANLYSINPGFQTIIYSTVEFMSRSEGTETQTPQRGTETPKNTPVDIETAKIDQRKEGNVHDQRPKLGIPTFD